MATARVKLDKLIFVLFPDFPAAKTGRFHRGVGWKPAEQFVGYKMRDKFRKFREIFMIRGILVSQIRVFRTIQPGKMYLILESEKKRCFDSARLIGNMLNF